LFLLNGVVYISWASHCDYQPYNGWMMGYDEHTMQQTAVYCVTPNGVEGGIWQSGEAPAVDSSGYIYFSSGNGTFDAYPPLNGPDYGMTLLKLVPSGNTLDLVDSFTPTNFNMLNSDDQDLGAGGVMILPTQPTPPTELIVAGGKAGAIYLADATNLGGYNDVSNQVYQCLPAGTINSTRSSPAYWEDNIYYVGVNDALKSFLLSGGYLSTTPVTQSANVFGYPGATPSISANGAANGIVWILDNGGYGNDPPSAAILYAFDASNATRQLYNSSINPGDTAGIASKFTNPTVANGKVYVGTRSYLNVYGLLPSP